MTGLTQVGGAKAGGPQANGTAGPSLADLRSKEDRYYYASQWELIWWRFKRHRLALISAILLILLYIMVIIPEFLAPYGAETRFSNLSSAPPARVHFVTDGRLVRPYVHGMIKKTDEQTFRRTFVEDPATAYPIYFFVKGPAYRWFGLIPSETHLFGTAEGAPPVTLFGTDKLSRDVFSRTLYGARISLTIGLIGVLLSFIIGVLLGGISGYVGGFVDMLIQRIVDMLMTIPQLPMWMVISAAVPQNWSVVQTYFAMTIVLSVVGWTGMARVVRGKLLALREEDYALAAKTAGARPMRIVTRHLLPGFTSHLIVSLTFAIPGMILGETALSFLGLGMQPPAVSWGVMLADAQNLVAIAQQSWLLIPVIFVIVTVLLFNFVGDGLRDAADPYVM